MRMIDCEQTLATFAHLALRRKQIFRRGFVGHTRIRCNIAHAIDSSGRAILTADETATFVGIGLARMRDDLVKMSFCESDQPRFVNHMWLCHLRCGKALPFRRYRWG